MMPDGRAPSRASPGGSMPPGASALHALLRAWPDAPVRAAPEGAEADGLVHTAVGHGLVGFVAHAVERAGWALPEPASASLRREALGNAARALRVKMLLLRSLDALATVGQVPVLLKGVWAGAAAVSGPVAASHHGRGPAGGTRGCGRRGPGAGPRGALGAAGRRRPARGRGLSPLGAGRAGGAGGAALPRARGMGRGAGGRRAAGAGGDGRGGWPGGAVATARGRGRLPGVAREQPRVAAVGVALRLEAAGAGGYAAGLADGGGAGTRHGLPTCGLVCVGRGAAAPGGAGAGRGAGAAGSASLAASARTAFFLRRAAAGGVAAGWPDRVDGGEAAAGATDGLRGAIWRPASTERRAGEAAPSRLSWVRGMPPPQPARPSHRQHARQRLHANLPHEGDATLPAVRDPRRGA
ncbi:hypothetical protein MXAN_1044 [Myxococcus xanthus DK 1622]|uniref:Uncharacterized protein n=1 Tax=Myxococcus xanthus (strain DK1622) TaxID=246197 RepID=Q1DDG8_MYXXD|nr:hypothetical protein MXAN_1044 [Myxococcus xanthus DK 1622]